MLIRLRSNPLLYSSLIGLLVLMIGLEKLVQRRPYLAGRNQQSTTLITPAYSGSADRPAASLTLSRDGKLMAYATEDPNIAAIPTIQQWRSDRDEFTPLRWKFSTTGNTKKPIYTGSYPAQCEFSEDGKTLTTSYLCSGITPAKYFVTGWDTTNGQEKWHFDGLKGFSPTDMFLSPQGQQLAVCELEKAKLTIFDLSKPQPLPDSKDLQARTFAVRAVLPVAGMSVAWSPDGQTLAVYTGPHIEFWDIKKKSRALPDTSELASSGGSRLLRWSPDGRYLATADTVTLAIWDTQTRQWTNTHYSTDSGYGAFDLAWMPDSKSLWVGGDSPNEGHGNIHQWSVPELEELREFPTKGPVAVSNDGQILATRNIDKKPNGVLIWNIG